MEQSGCLYGPCWTVNGSVRLRTSLKMFVFVALALTLVSAIYLWQKSVYKYWSDRGVAHPKPRFPLGTLDSTKNFVYRNDEVYKQFKGERFAGVFAILTPSIAILDLDLVKQIIVKDANHFQSRGVYYNEEDDPISAHLFSMENQKWKALRQKLTPTFTSGKMKQMCSTVVEVGNRFDETIARMVARGDRGIDMRDMFARFTTDVIGTCAFGLECNSLQDPKARFREVGMKVFNEPRWPAVVQALLASCPGLGRKLHMKIIPEGVSEFFTEAVTETVEHRIKQNIKRNDFIDLLIELRNEQKSNSLADAHKEGLSMNEIAAQCFVFFLAGFETSSTASSFTIYELAKNQEVQDKLRTHIREVLKKHDGKITYESLKDMDYLEQCLNEGMRKYPPLPMLNRSVTKDYQIPDSNVVLPKGMFLSIPIYSFHHDPDYFPDPEKFDPDRFSPEEVKQRNAFAFLPFGEGARNCIGERFGMMQAKIGMAHLIGNYRFKLNSKTKPIKFMRDTFILTPEGSLYFDVEKV